MLNILRPVVQEMRPWQWTKNILVYAALLFSGTLFVEDKFMLTTAAYGKKD